MVGPHSGLYYNEVGLFIISYYTSCSLSFPRCISSIWASQVELVAKNLPVSAGDEGDVGPVSELGRFPAEGRGNPLPYARLGNPTERRAWQAAVHGVVKSQNNSLKQLSTLLLLLISFVILLRFFLLTLFFI